MGVKAYVVQLYGFLVKVFTQRWRAPVATLIEILLPLLFTLLLSIGYWTTDSTIIPATSYDAPGFNIGYMAESSFCTMPGSTLISVWPACDLVATPPYMYKCLGMLGNGREVCLPYAKYGLMSGLLYAAVYYSTNSTVISSMDGYLTMSALITEEARAENPTFFGRGGRASMAHFGELVVVSDDAALATEFMDFCRTNSGMCGTVLHPTAFTTMEDANNYATANAPNVWAIVSLPKTTVTASDQAVFTISMNYSATPETGTKSRHSPFTRGVGTSGSAGFVLYTTSGFLTLQNFVQQFYFRRHIGDASLVVAGPATVPLARDALPMGGLPLVPMPTPERYDNAFLTEWAYYLPLVAMLAALFPVARLTAMIVEEKSKGIREAMLIMGLYPSCMFAGWYAAALIVDLVASLLAAMVLKVGFLHRVHYGVLLVVYFSFMQQNTAFAMLISTVFSNPRVASWCAAFLLFVCAMPYYSLPDDMDIVGRIFMSLVPCIGYAESFGIMIDYVSFGHTFDWRAAHEGQYCVAVAIGMMWASFFVMMVLAMYLDRVAPAAVGVRAHPLFFLAPLFRLCRKDEERFIPMRNDAAAGDHESSDCKTETVDKADKDASVSLIEHRDDIVSTCDPEIAAIFHRLRKQYICGGLIGFFYTYFTGLFRKGDFVVALDDVTFAMKSGEVSVLLGANGAGKSTIMGMATGMVSPTSGDVYIRGYNASYDLNKCRENIGYCPQSDIVWSSLTVEEHFAFYARLKGSHTFNVDAAVSKAVDLVGLEEKRDCLAGNLSGGQKRRLCVGMALVGDSSVLFLDEPTAGMDVKGRRAMYQTLNRARVNRSVLLSTHLLDEADRIGDRILLVNEGRLCAEGSAMYLKSQMKVGYVVTCVIESGLGAPEEDRAVSDLIDFVRDKGYEGHHIDPSEVQAIPAGCKLLGVERRGREVSFRFPLSLLSMSGAALLGELRAHDAELHLRTIGLHLTTLEDVFMSVTQGAPLMSSDAGAVEGAVQEREGDVRDAEHAGDEAECDRDHMYASSGCFAVFLLHFRALFLKRCHYGKRDVKMIFFQVVIPIVFLSLSFLITLISSPRQPALTLDMTMYKNYATDPAMATLSSGVPDSFALASSAPIPDEAPGRYYVTEFIRGSIMNAHVLSPYLMSTLDNFTHRRFFALSASSMFMSLGNMTNMSTISISNTAIVLHNASYPHTAPQALSSLYNVAGFQLWGDKVPQLSVRNQPMELGAFESQMFDTSKQVLMGIFVLLAFVLIPSNTISYIVREKESGARHMQLLSGASVAAYWLSSFAFDAACYVGTEILAFIIFFIFDRTEFIASHAIGPSIVLFFFYGITSIASGYVLSFFFRSPFAAQTVVLLANFVLGFLWVMVEDMLLSSALNFVESVNYVARVFPSVCFGEGVFVLSGNQLAMMMFPNREKPRLFSLLSLSNARFEGGIGTGLIYMGCVFVGSIIALIVLEYMRIVRVTQRVSNSCNGCCTGGADREDARACADGVAMADTSASEEEQRVCARETGPAEDCIAVQHLSKRFFGSRHAAVDDVSLGVHEGEVMGLLGLNGAGKTTLVGMLAGEVDASGGAAYVNHLSVASAKSRAYVGYCPQYDALLDYLTPVEHLWLYARLRGMREEVIADEVKMLIRELGLHPHRHQTAEALSGGNRRRLSLAIALVGRTTSVLLDEPTAGMDALARHQTCTMIRRLTKRKSVILTTHLLDEVDALADRVAFLARGQLRAVGTPQELRSRYTDENVFTMGVQFPHDVRLDDGVAVEKVHQHILDTVRSHMSEDDVEGASCEVLEVHSSSVVLSVRGRLAAICAAMSSLRDGTVDGVPPVSYVSVSQSTLEDILLLD